MPLFVIVLAAGQGKRMRSALPKVLQPLAGRPILAHVLATARSLEPAGIHVVYGHGGDRVIETFKDETLDWCLQAEQLGTGHAVQQALPHVAPDHLVLVLCGDVPLVRAEALRQLIDQLPAGGIALATAELADPAGYGRIVREAANGRISRIVEHRDASESEKAIREINTGLLAAKADDLGRWLARLDNVNAQREYYLTDIIALAVADGREVHGVLIDPAEEALGINDKLQLASAERDFQKREAERLMGLGATLADPARLDVRGTLTIGSDVFIDVGVVFSGSVTLEDGVSVGPYSLISDSHVGRGSRILANSMVESANVGANCEIGPFARLRPGAELADKTKVGNFVEIKNSVVAEGSKVNHLSYIGDADIGRDVNVGAGTITCNYDGATKHRTTIGDGAFIGSGVMLVAPIEVGKDATVGAGSTLARNAPAGQLTLTRPPQKSVEGWKRPSKPNKTSD